MKRNEIAWIAAAVLLVAVAGGVGWYWSRNDAAVETPDHGPQPPRTAVVSLTPAKRSNLSIRTQRVEIRPLRESVTVPGRIRYDDTRRVSIRAATVGTVRAVSVRPGSEVSAGDLLGVLDSPEVGAARSDVLKRQSEAGLAAERAAWQRAVRTGIDGLVEQIRAGAAVDGLTESVESGAFGQAGGELIRRYNEYLLARDLAENARQIGSTAALSGRVVRQRESDRERAAAALTSTIEQTTFDARQAEAAATAELSDARRRLRLARHCLTALTGVTPSDAAGIDISPNDPDLSRFNLSSPIDGTVESRSFAANERYAVGDELFVIADTSRLWVEADIRIGDWGASVVSPGDTLRVETPAIEDRTFEATVAFVGPVVDGVSHALSVVATVANRDGALRPGMYVRAEVPAGPGQDVLAVPESAVVDIDGQSHLFVAEGDQYEAEPVEVRQAFGRWIEVEGIAAGTAVVTEGAFTLKSELLLEEGE